VTEDVEADGQRQRRRGQQRGGEVRRGEEVADEAGGEERVGQARERRRGRGRETADGCGQTRRHCGARCRTDCSCDGKRTPEIFRQEVYFAPDRNFAGFYQSGGGVLLLRPRARRRHAVK
jgi:hypothetical protein